MFCADRNHKNDAAGITKSVHAFIFCFLFLFLFSFLKGGSSIATGMVLESPDRMLYYCNTN